MSFAKARIQRFNELPSEVPPPGAYDPKFEGKVKGLVIEKTERFQDSGKSVTSSVAECNSSVSSKGAGPPIPSPKFRTPQLPKKRNTATKPANMSCPKAKVKLVLGAKKELKYDVRDELADLKVECENKDRTIQDHAKQIEEMKKEAWRLEKELVGLRTKHEEIEEQHKTDLESMAKLQQEILDSRDEKHRAEMERLRLRLLEITKAKEEEASSHRTGMEEIEQRFTRVHENSTILIENVTGIELKVQTVLTELMTKLNDLEHNKLREIDELSGIVDDKKRELSQVQAELQRVELLSDQMCDQLTQLRNDRENDMIVFKTEEKGLRAQITGLSEEKEELQSKLETRQRVILELQSQLSTLQCEVDELRAEYERFASVAEENARELAERHDREMADARNEFIREMEYSVERAREAEIARRLELENEIRERDETNVFLVKQLENLRALYDDAKHRLDETERELEASSRRHAEELKNGRQCIEDIKSLFFGQRSCDESSSEPLIEKWNAAKLTFFPELNTLYEAHKKAVDAVKTEAEKTVDNERRQAKEHSEKIVANAEALTRQTLAACRTECEERVNRAMAEADEKVKDMMRDARSAVDMEMRETADRYASCVSRIEAERSMLEEKLAQRDAEIVKLTSMLDELRIVVGNHESFSQSLQADLDRVEAELAGRKDELRALKDQIRSEAAEMVARRRRFQVVMAENQASVAALSQRLAESDAEVERLQNELKSGEDSIHEHRGLLSAMRNTSKILTEEVYTLMEQLDANRGIVDRLEAGNLAEIESLRSLFYAEIENLKEISAKEITRLEDECKIGSNKNAELKRHLEAMAVKLDEARDMLLKCEEREDVRINEMSRLELENEKLERKLKSQTQTLDMNIEAEKRIVDLTQKHQIAEEKIKTLSEDYERLRQSYQETTEKYAEVIGHHNHKQRVKHLSQMKDKIIRLEKDVETKNHVIEQQSKTIEKLKAEDKQQQRNFAKGKENLHSHGISRSPYTTPASSPLKPLTPLRDRNE